MGACPHRHTNGMVKCQMDGEYRKSRHDTESNGVGGGMPPPYDRNIHYIAKSQFDEVLPAGVSSRLTSSKKLPPEGGSLVYSLWDQP